MLIVSNPPVRITFRGFRKFYLCFTVPHKTSASIQRIIYSYGRTKSEILVVCQWDGDEIQNSGDFLRMLVYREGREIHGLLLQQSPQSSTANPQPFGGCGLIAAGFLQHSHRYILTNFCQGSV